VTETAEAASAPGGEPDSAVTPVGTGATPARVELIAAAAVLGLSVLTQAGGLDFAWPTPGCRSRSWPASCCRAT